MTIHPHILRLLLLAVGVSLLSACVPASPEPLRRSGR